MNLNVIACLLFAGALLSACGGSDEEDKEEGDGDSDPALSVPMISFGVDGERALTSLNDEEIQSACEDMAEIFRGADEGIVCQVVSAASAGDPAACEEQRDECLANPEGALDETSLRASPGDLDCTKFEAELTSDCDFPVSLLEDCVNSIAQSVVPAAEAVRCQSAAKISDLDAANEAATNAKDPSFASICMDLLACEGLVGALLGGGMTGAGGATN